MRIKYILAVAIVALFVVPGTASQLAARAATASPGAAVAASGTAGLFDDPHVAPTLSIELPVRFVALDIGSHPLQSFNG
jgi:hypothetical protein